MSKLPDEEKRGEATGEMGSAEEVLERKDRNVVQVQKETAPLETVIENLKKLLELEKKKSEDYLTRIKYVQADFDNYRKRIDREVKDLEEFSTAMLVRKLLPIMDELELAIASAEAGKDSKPVIEGLKMVLKNLVSTLEAEGLKPIEAVGKPFKPELHEAVDKVQGTRGGDDVVIEEIRRGFTFRDRVLRPSMVKVELAARPQSKNTGGPREIGDNEQ